VYAAKKISNGISATAAADCIAPDWPISQQPFPHEKSTPSDATSHQNSLTTCELSWS